MSPILIGIILLLVFVVLYMLFNTGSTSKSLDPPVANTPPPSLQASKPAAPEPASVPNKVTELQSADEARAFLAKPEAGILLVYAPWCGHCRSMMADYEAVSNQTQARIARLDGARAQDFMREKEIRGFPTLFTVSAKGVVDRWMGGRDQASLLNGATALLNA